MKMYETMNYYILEDARDRLAPAVKDPGIRQRAIEPETVLRLAWSLCWLAPGQLDTHILDELATARVLWERPDPSFKLYDCGCDYIVVSHDHDYAPIGATAGRLWEDPTSFMRYNAAGSVAWASDWVQPEAVKARCQDAVARGELLWEVPET